MSEYFFVSFRASFFDVGCRALRHYKAAASLGDKRAAQRLKSQTGPLPSPGGGPNAAAMLSREAAAAGEKSGKDCVIM